MNGSGGGTVRLIGGIIVGVVTILAVALSFLDGRMKPLEQGQERESNQIRELINRDREFMVDRIRDLDEWRDKVRDELAAIRERVSSLEQTRVPK